MRLTSKPIVQASKVGHNVSISRASSSAELVQLLRRNKELSESDAKNEVRWITQAVRAQPVSSTSSTTPGEKDRPRSQLGEEDQISLVRSLVERRANGEPLQYILGAYCRKAWEVELTKGDEEFGPLRIKCRAPTLIPRQETAYIFSHLASKISKNSVGGVRIHDVCTGSGCIALLLAHLLPSSTITGSDLSPEAVSLARENAANLGLDVSFEFGDIMDPIRPLGPTSERRTIDILVSNPPYIPKQEWDVLPPSVRTYEDPRALIGDPSDLPNGIRPPDMSQGSDGAGLAFYRQIAQLLPSTLTPPSALKERGIGGIPRAAVEVGHDQAPAVASIFETRSEGFITRTEMVEDQYGVQRMVIGYSA